MPRYDILREPVLPPNGTGHIDPAWTGWGTENWYHGTQFALRWLNPWSWKPRLVEERGEGLLANWLYKTLTTTQDRDDVYLCCHPYARDDVYQGDTRRDLNWVPVPTRRDTLSQVVNIRDFNMLPKFPPYARDDVPKFPPYGAHWINTGWGTENRYHGTQFALTLVEPEARTKKQTGWSNLAAWLDGWGGELEWGRWTQLSYGRQWLYLLLSSRETRYF